MATALAYITSRQRPLKRFRQGFSDCRASFG